MTEATTLYDDDFFAWTKEQAKALRAAARAGSNLQLDWENLAEEIEALGKSDRRELGSRIREIAEHLVKLELSPSSDPRAGWRASVRRQRAEIEDILKESPSLRRQLGSMIRDQTRRGALNAVAELRERGELDERRPGRTPSRSYAEGLSYTRDQVLGDWFPPEPPRE